MGKRSEFLRIERDNYATPASALGPLLTHLAPGTRYIEPCCGEGALVSHLTAAGHLLYSAHDLPDDDARITRYEVGSGVVFITNPPYWGQPRDLHPLIVNLSSQAPTWLLMSADWAHNRSSGELVRQRCRLIVSIGRLRWIPDSEFSGKDNCAWYLFEHPSAWGQTRFIGREERAA
jgi:hypothetical protein